MLFCDLKLNNLIKCSENWLPSSLILASPKVQYLITKYTENWLHSSLILAADVSNHFKETFTLT